jgi:hypothetical protein
LLSYGLVVKRFIFSRRNSDTVAKASGKIVLVFKADGLGYLSDGKGRAEQKLLGFFNANVDDKICVGALGHLLEKMDEATLAQTALR